MVHIRQTSSLKASRRRYYPLLAILTLVLASLACIDTKLSLTVNHNENSMDKLEVIFEQGLSPSFIKAAKEVNAERANDFKEANRPLTEPLLPESREDLAELFDTKKYDDKKYDIFYSETGFSAQQTFPLNPDQKSEDWSVKIIQDPEHPELIKYRVKVYIDLADIEDLDLHELRTQKLEKPDLKVSGDGDMELSGSPLGDLFSMMGAVKESAEQEMKIELYYAQKALQASDPMKYTVIIELPGKVEIHELDGVKAGTLDGNQVTLVLDEKTLMDNVGKKLVYYVESSRKDCRLACDPDKDLVWDGDETDQSCKCTCKKGMFVLEDPPEGDTTQLKCEDCQMVCGFQNDELVVDLEKCEPGVCACMCKPPLVSSWEGLKCITEEEAWLESNLISENGPSLDQIKAVVEAIVDPDNQKDLSLMPGWNFLTSRQRELLVQRLESLGNAVDRTRLTIDKVSEMTTGDKNKRILNKELRLKLVRDMAIAKAKEKFEHRQKVHRIIRDEIGGLYRFARYIPDVISALFSTPYELAVNYVEDKLTSTVTERIQKEVLGEKVPTIKETAEKLIEDIPNKATEDTVLDYYQYKEIYDSKCDLNCSEKEAEKAHFEALAELREYLKGVPEKGYKGINRLNWAKEGDAYDHAFRKINQSVPRLEDD